MVRPGRAASVASVSASVSVASAWGAGGRWPAGALVVLVGLFTSGCSVVGFGAHVLGGGGRDRVVVEAQYTGLAGHEVAVVVQAGDEVLYGFPGVTSSLGRAVGRGLAAALQGSRVVASSRVDLFTQEQPYWGSWPYAEVMRRLEAERLVWVELDRFEVREPGNAYVLRGVGVARVGVAEAEADDPNQLAFSTTVEARYPPGDSPGAKIGVTNGDEATVREATVASLAEAIVNLFHTHELPRQR